MAKNKGDNKKLSEHSRINAKLDAALETLENLFILGAVEAGIPSVEIRKMLGTSQSRVSSISKHIEKQRKQDKVPLKQKQ